MVLRAREKVCAIFTTQEGNERGDSLVAAVFPRRRFLGWAAPFAIDCKFSDFLRLAAHPGASDLQLTAI